MTEKYFVQTGYHGVHYIRKGAKRYKFIDTKKRNLEALCDLLNDFKGDVE